MKMYQIEICIDDNISGITSLPNQTGLFGLSTSGTPSTQTAKAIAIKNCEFLLSQFLLLFGKGKNKKDGTRAVAIKNCEPRNLDCEYLLLHWQKQERQNKKSCHQD